MVPQLFNICPRHIRTMPLNAKPPVEITTSRRRLRDPGFKIRDRDLKKHSRRKITRKRNLSQTLPRFRDRAKIFPNPRFSRNHSILLNKIF